MRCLECDQDFSAGKDLSNHIKKIHGMTGEDYTIKHLHSGVRPMCNSCGGSTRYTAFSFKRFCCGCSDVASSEGGKEGGKAPAWNKGKKAIDDPRIAAQSVKFLGEGNPFFGKRHTDISRQRISDGKRISEETFYQRIGSRADVLSTTSYQSFVSRNERNISCRCNRCEKEFSTSLSYLERDFRCPHCHERINPFKGKTRSNKTRESMRRQSLLSSDEFNERVVARESEFSLLTTYEDYFSRQKQYLKFMCKACGTVSEKTLQAFERGSLCRKCFPHSSSRAELEIGNFIESLGIPVVRNDRLTIKPKEIDILVRDKGVGFEYDGLYWHSEQSQKPVNYQLDKTRACLDAGISLFRIYSDQWETKREIVMSMVRSRLGLVSRKVQARKCSVVEIDPVTSRDFFERNHLYGSSPAKKHFALSHEGEIISVVSMRIPRQDKHRREGAVEVCRFATRLDTIVVGGFSKILSSIKTWALEQGFSKILTYADLDTGTGGVYAKAGFELIGDTGPAYWYTDGLERFDRFKYRAANGKSEREMAEASGVYRVYGAGSRIYSLSLVIIPGTSSVM